MHAVDDSIASDPMDEPAGSRLPNPQVRTLLLTDLCDSTMLVERLGDNAAAELFRAHDRLVLELQQRWRGRLIDRSDGLLLLFERAIDGLGFALDYARGLRELGERAEVAKSGVELRARAGLHVGEVLTWRNSDAAVNVGAKPLEVEGLAKPMAGRLMTLARPGQILLSATAESLAHRAARELGERGDNLLWKSHGRWRFKGVPQAQEVCEVGEPGIAPLRAPRQNRSKAWRDIPLWRRPTALAAELLLVAGLAGGGWFLTRPQPAIAFGERDWVVVGDLRNLTGDKLLDESLEQAFRISLEQSRYVNVLSDLKARDTLDRMRRKPDTVLDRTIASEIALRDGARAVILPTVAEIGGRVRVSAEVIDPHTQTTVYAESADGSGAQSTLHSIDKVTSALRGKLGEALQSIQRSSVSLPNVTTSNLDALKAYALGRKYSSAGDAAQAIAYYRQAVKLDPEFALALAAIAGVQAHVLGEYAAARNEYAAAMRLAGRLSPRDVMKLEVSMARLGPPGPAMEQARQLLGIYPDELDTQLTLAQLELWERNDPAAALPHAVAAAVPQAQRLAPAHYMQGVVLVALGRDKEAIREFQLSRQLGYDGAKYNYAYAYAMRRDWAGVARLLGSSGNDKTGKPAIDDVSEVEQAALFALDQGHWDEALGDSRIAIQRATRSDPLLYATDQRIRALAIQTLSESANGPDLVARVESELASLDANAAKLDAQLPSYRMSAVQALGYIAARLDAAIPLRRAIATTAAIPAARDYPTVVQMQVILGAELERIRAKPGDSTRQAHALAARPDGLVLVHSTLMRSMRASGDVRGAAIQARWLAAHRGQAYVERPATGILSAFNIADTTLALLVQAEAAAGAGDATAARRLRSEFTRAWVPDRLPPSLKARLLALPG